MRDISGCREQPAWRSPWLLPDTSLRQAVDDRRIETHYQPILDLTSQTIVGFEALSRWQHEGLRIKPSRFIGLAERSGVIDDLTWLVVERVCRQLQTWKLLDGQTRLHVGINIPAPSLGSHDLVPQILITAEKHGIDAEKLTLEVTESMPIRDISEASQTLQTARDHGMEVSLDDFGTGCNSIAHLLQLPISKVKIDPTMVRGIELDTSRTDVVAGMVTLATQRGLIVVAEGVENTRQLNLLRQMGVNHVQDFLLGRPNPSEHWHRLLTESATIDLDDLNCEETTGAGNEPKAAKPASGH